MIYGQLWGFHELPVLFWRNMSLFIEKTEEILLEIYLKIGKIYPLYTSVVRYILPLLALIVIIRCAVSLLKDSIEPEQWGYLSLPGGVNLTLSHWENTIGRARSADVFINIPTVSRNHGAIIRASDGTWRVYDLGSKTGIFVNRKEVIDNIAVKSGDIITVGGVDMVFMPIDKAGERAQAQYRSKPGYYMMPSVTLLLLTLFQLFLSAQHIVSCAGEPDGRIVLGFAGLTAIMWLTFAFTRLMRRHAFEIETLAYLLTTVGFSVAASSAAYDMIRQIGFLAAGVVFYFCIGWFLRNLDRAKRARIVIAAAGLILLGVNLVMSKAVFGAKNWLSIAGFSFQPSEFVKICFIFAGAATLDRLFTKRNLVFFIGFAGCCTLCLMLMSDFGTGLIFFVTYLVIAFMRSGSIGTIFLSVGGAAFGGMVAISAKPYIAARFKTWRHAWDSPHDSGYQQTRTMSAAASGGLFGVGAGNGWLHTVFAANTDMVFGVVSEELGLIISILCIAAIIIMGIYAVKYAANARSSFYTIASCAAAAMFVFQMMLNVLGCVDILPFTGVTFPFVSKGGSSLVACWGLLAFIKACDTRQNASFTVKLPKKVRADEVYNEYVDEEDVNTNDDGYFDFDGWYDD